MVFCYEKCSDVCTVSKNCSICQVKLLKFEAEAREFANFEISRRICSNSERSEHFLVTECILTCSYSFLRSNKLEQLEFKLEKIIGI